MMLMEPASKVSVPLRVVIRTWVSVADSALEPAPREIAPTLEVAKLLADDQLFVAESISEIVIDPFMR
jgi:hypothetical protein